MGQALRAESISFHQLTPPQCGGKRTEFAGSRQATENPVNPSHQEPLFEERPRAEAFACFGVRVIWNPSAAKPLNALFAALYELCAATFIPHF